VLGDGAADAEALGGGVDGDHVDLAPDERVQPDALRRD
jgi:hypothetical protein